MKKRIKKIISTSLLALTLAGAGGSIASAVYWNYGRTVGLWSYSHVQSGVYEHAASANGGFSGWKRPGIVGKYV